MNKLLVCKTVVPHPQMTQYVLVLDDGERRTFPDIADFAEALRRLCTSKPRPQAYIKNEAPGDIFWERGCKASGDVVDELERLSRNEVRELAELLRQ